MDYEEFLAYRDSLIQLEQAHSSSFDRHMLTLSTGAFGLSLFVMRDIVGDKPVDSECWLILSWWCLGVSMLAILLSFLAAIWACKSLVRQWDKRYKQGTTGKMEPLKSKWGDLANVLQPLAGIAFLAGVILLSTFIVRNL